jgi:hypothetical protein
MNKSSAQFIAITLLLLAIAYLIFSQGMGGGLYIDDMGNLGTLSQVHTLESAMQFAFSGNSGPSGRPLSLASFALQAGSWPHKPEAFIQVNILIHLLNGALVAWFSLLLANSAGIVRKAPFSLLLTALWLLNPIQVSPVLLIVQRMTLLSGLFTFLGLIFYLLGRTSKTNGKVSWFWIFLAFAMTIPATFSKENGVLLPGFLLILELFLFSRRGDSCHSALRTKLLAAWSIGTLLLGLLFLYRYWPSFAESFAAKGYTLPQHIATEARAVAHYLSQIMMPNMPEFGPFHDDFPVSEAWHDLRALAATACLAVLAGLSWFLRNRSPLFAAGVCFFLWGHALESSVIPLEPYFEHRNYIPMLGVAIALAGLVQLITKHQKLASAGLAGLLLLSTFSTYQYAAIWGQRGLAIQYWYSERPESVRALLFYTDHLAQQNQWSEVNEIVGNAWRANPQKMSLAMPMLYVACRASNKRLDEQELEKLIHIVREGPFTIRVANHLDKVADLVTSKHCAAVSPENILAILDALAANPHYQIYAETVSDLLVIRAKVLYAQGHVLQSAMLLNEAVGHSFRIDIALQGAKMFAVSAHPTEADRLVKLSRANLPSNPWLRAKWLRDIENTQATIARFHKIQTPATS